VKVMAGPVQGNLMENLKKMKISKLGVDGSKINMILGEAIKKIRPIVTLVNSREIIESLRVQKSDNEIKILRGLARQTVRIWESFRKNVRVGMTEHELASAVDVEIRRGGYYNSFPTIAAVGKNTAFPHAVPGNARLRRAEHALFDFGIQHEGYCSDLTRIWVKGRISRKIKRLYDAVLLAHDNAIQKLEPGVRIGDVVKGVNKLLIDKGLGSYICHSLGHGVGLNIHEDPFLREASEEVLREGMVVTVEPGLYDVRCGGIRIEDMVLITAKGREVLTQ